MVRNSQVHGLQVESIYMICLFEFIEWKEWKSIVSSLQLLAGRNSTSVLTRIVINVIVPLVSPHATLVIRDRTR